MTEPSTSPVEELRSRLAGAQDWAAKCREAAEQAANRLISEPSIEQIRSGTGRPS